MTGLMMADAPKLVYNRYSFASHQAVLVMS